MHISTINEIIILVIPIIGYFIKIWLFRQEIICSTWWSRYRSFKGRRVADHFINGFVQLFIILSRVAMLIFVGTCLREKKKKWNEWFCSRFLCMGGYVFAIVRQFGIEKLVFMMTNVFWNYLIEYITHKAVWKNAAWSICSTLNRSC